MTTTSVIEFNTVTDTGSGSVTLWDPAAFTHVTHYETWERELLELEEGEHISAGHLVPLNILSDGRFGVRVRFCANTAPTPNEREAAYREHESESYLFRSTGSVHVTGVECVGFYPDEDLPETFSLPAGEYAARVHLIDWASEPGMRLPDGDAAPEALPDFLVLIGPVTDRRFRQSDVTFDGV